MGAAALRFMRDEEDVHSIEAARTRRATTQMMRGREIRESRTTLVEPTFSLQRCELQPHSFRLSPHGNTVLRRMIEGQVKFGGQNDGNRQQ
jgi:hypothetical protein